MIFPQQGSSEYRDLSNSWISITYPLLNMQI